MSPKVESLRVCVLRRQHMLKSILKTKKEIKETEEKMKEKITESKENKLTVDLQILGIDMMPTYDDLFAKTD